MAKDIFFGNVMPTPLSAFGTGDAEADAAIARLQSWPHSPHTPRPPGGKEYDALTATAERVGPQKLLALLDDAALATGRSRWSDEHKASLGNADKKLFQKRYDEVLAALAVRKAYLQWLVGAVCNTPAGLTRALEVLERGTVDARNAVAFALQHRLTRDEARRRVAEAFSLAAWDGRDAQELFRVYQLPVALLNAVDPAAALKKYQPLLTPAELKRKGGEARARAVLQGLMASPPSPEWIPLVLPLIEVGDLDNSVFLLLDKLPPDERVVGPLCAALPKPDPTDEYWNQHAVKQLGRSANKAAVPWLIGALHSSWMNWAHAFDGFERAEDPVAIPVIEAWLAENDAPDRVARGKAVVKHLSKFGPVPAAAAAPRKKEAPAPVRPTLVFTKTKPFKKPKLEPLAKQEAAWRKRFVAAGLGPAFDTLARPSVVLLPTRVDETKLKTPGGTKLGGHPDLDAKAKWPRVKGEPLTFLAQVDLAEFAPHLGGALPKAGLLSFFVGNVGGSERAGYCEHAVVLFTKPGTKLVRHDVPDDFFDVIYQACTVTLHPVWSLPSPSNPHVTRALKSDALEKYEGDVFDHAVPLPRVGGHRDHGYDAGTKASDVMLLQLPGDPQTTMEFGDVDALSFFSDAKRAAKGDFSKVKPKLGD